MEAHDDGEHEGAWEDDEPDAEPHASQTSKLCACTRLFSYVLIFMDF